MNDGPLGVTRTGGSEFHWGSRTYVMGIVNVSPESFSGDGLADSETAVEQALRMVEDGALLMVPSGSSRTEPISWTWAENRPNPVILPFLQTRN